MAERARRQKKASSYLLAITRDTHNGDREKIPSQANPFNICTIGAMDRTSAQTSGQVEFVLLRSNSFKFQSLHGATKHLCLARRQRLNMK